MDAKTRFAAAGWLMAVALADARQLPADRARPPDSSVVHGRVIADNANPVRNARVAIESAAADSGQVLTDGDGRFSVRIDPTAPPMLVVSKTGYVTTRARAASADIQLTKGAAITGIVLDDYGAPVPLVRAVAERRTVVDGRVTFERQSSVDTDDTGQFRLFGLPAGDYVVGVSGVRMIWAAGRPPIALPIDAPPHAYYTDAARPDTAQIVRIAAGGEVNGINFTIQIPAPSISSAAPNPQRRAAEGIRGRIVRADGLPLKRARVELSSADRLFAPLFTLSDEDGRYEFAEIPPGRYLVAATGAGFTMGTYRQRHTADRGDVIVVAPGRTADHIDVTVPATSAIAGRVVDEYGEAIERATVQVDELRWANGRLQVTAVSGIATRQTDDFGRFRVFGLLPGRYVISAVVGQPMAGYTVNDLPGYMKTYFPGTVAAGEAQPVEVVPGQDALNVEVPLVRGRAGSISGVVLTASGAPFDGAVHLVASNRSRAVATVPLRVRADQGRFRFAPLAPGEYVIQAATARLSPSVEGEFGAQFVTVAAAAVENVVVQMSSGSSIAGRVIFEQGMPPPDAEVRLSPTPADVDFIPLADNPVARARVNGDWTFEMGGINGPRRLSLLRSPDGWMLSRITAGGADITDAAFVFGTPAQSLSDVEVVLTNRVTGLAGTVTDDRDQPAADATVIAFAADRSLWYPQSRFIASASVAKTGAFTLRVPPGSYFVAALDAREAPETIDSGVDPGLLRKLEAAAGRVTLSEAEEKTVRLRLRDR